jgi:hypothetical protein
MRSRIGSWSDGPRSSLIAWSQGGSRPFPGESRSAGTPHTGELNLVSRGDNAGDWRLFQQPGPVLVVDIIGVAVAGWYRLHATRGPDAGP